MIYRGATDFGMNLCRAIRCVLLTDEERIMDIELTPAVKDLIRSAARKLTGFRRRQFQAEMALQYCGGQPRRAEEIFGWGREAVRTGLGEHAGGIQL